MEDPLSSLSDNGNGNGNRIPTSKEWQPPASLMFQLGRNTRCILLSRHRKEGELNENKKSKEREHVLKLKFYHRWELPV